MMSTSQGTCVRIEQTSEVIRVTYEMCGGGGARTGIENRCSKQCAVKSSNVKIRLIRVHLECFLSLRDSVC